MAFTTQFFIFVFFPICLCMYYLVVLLQHKGLLSGIIAKCRISDLVLVGISSCFYMYAIFDDISHICVYISYVYALFLVGVFIEKFHCKKRYLITQNSDGSDKNVCVPLGTFVFAAAIIGVVCVLVRLKYTGLLSRVWSGLFRDTLSEKNFFIPAGISFITFTAISYLADIYMGKAKAGSFIDCALYLTFFPKIISGPIVLWRDFKNQIADRKITLVLVSDGITRIMIGFAKKLILADTFGACIASVSGSNVDVITAWGVSLLYMLQIYYDFSGYSDIAIGLSNMLGFSFKENFNFPYLSCSITEFWRRWHISLGTWFREYVYFPLGGSRRGRRKTLFNIAVVFALTGIWHGAGFTYMLWGMINGLCNIVEKMIADKAWYKKTPSFLKWAITMTITIFCWIPFRLNSFSACITWLAIMLGQKVPEHIPYFWNYYFDTQMIFFVVVGVLGATVLGLPKVQTVCRRFYANQYGFLISQFTLFALFILSISFMFSSTYSPFIYFQY